MSLPGTIISDLQAMMRAAVEPDSRLTQLQFKVLARALIEMNVQVSILHQQIVAGIIDNLSREIDLKKRQSKTE